jgi:hypothetical protein
LIAMRTSIGGQSRFDAPVRDQWIAPAGSGRIRCRYATISFPKTAIACRAGILSA